MKRKNRKSRKQAKTANVSRKTSKAQGAGSFFELLGSDNMADVEKKMELIRSNIENDIRESMLDYGRLQYALMKKEDQWGGYNQDMVEKGYDQLKSGYLFEQSAVESDQKSFKEELVDQNKYLDLTLEQLKEKEQIAGFKILREIIPFSGKTNA